MQTLRPLLIAVDFLLSVQLLAQNPLVGTWEFVSAKGRDAAGKAIVMDTTAMREIKVITPTHYMFIAQQVKGDSLVFHRSQAGSIVLQGSKYTEVPLMSSQPGADVVKTDLTWKLQGDKFIRQGTATLADGKKITIEELVFQRVKSPKAYSANPALGAWNSLSANIVIDGKKMTFSYPSTKQFQIITPTHWMVMTEMDNKFDGALWGTYTLEGEKAYEVFAYSSYPNRGVKSELTRKVVGDKLYQKGFTQDKKGNAFIAYDEVYERVKPTTKTASVK